jgi:adenine-specific DNA-methyltransferase
MILSYNDESWIPLDDLLELCTSRGDVVALAFDSARYVGAQIGIHNPSGVRVGEVSHLRNLEYVLVCGEPAAVARVTAPYDDRKVTATAGSTPV